jgi:hypothetical protein
MVYNGYYKVMSNIPKMGQLPTPDIYIYIQHMGYPRLGRFPLLLAPLRDVPFQAGKNPGDNLGALGVWWDRWDVYIYIYIYIYVYIDM